MFFERVQVVGSGGILRHFRRPKGWGWSRGGLLLTTLLAICVCLGGGGIGVADFNLFVQAVCLVALGRIGSTACIRFIKDAPTTLLILVGLTIAVPAMQLIPLPPTIWIMLPGRGPVTQSLELISASQVWMPFSLDPNRTAIALFAVLACLPLLVLSASVDRVSARFVSVTIVGLGVLSAFLGAVQLSRGNQGLVLQPRGVIPHQLYATFANHNAAGLFFVICLVCLTSISADWVSEHLLRRHAHKAGKGADALSSRIVAAKLVLGALFVLCTVLSQSRSALLVLAVVAIWIVVRWRRLIAHKVRSAGVALSPRRMWLVLAVVTSAVAGLGLAAGNHSIRQSLARFEEVDDPRFGIWQDVGSSIATYMPFGAGVGTFDAVFPLDESLEAVTPLKTGRAHSDYLEVMVEMGVGGPLLILAWALWIGSRAWRAQRGRDNVQASAACMVLLCLALQSAVDYPLRNMAMLAVAAAMIGLLSRPSEAPACAEQLSGGGAA